MQSLCVYCGASTGADAQFAEAAQTLGRTLAHRDIRLVYGGGSVGLMGEVANAALDAGGKVTGVIPEALWNREVGHPGLTEISVVPTMHVRKAQLIDLSDAFVALPGGFGTLDELFEVLTWQQIGYHQKPVGLLNIAGYYDSLLTFIQQAKSQGFIRGAQVESLVVDTDVGRLIDRLSRSKPVQVDRWIKHEVAQS